MLSLTTRADSGQLQESRESFCLTLRFDAPITIDSLESVHRLAEACRSAGMRVSIKHAANLEIQIELSPIGDVEERIHDAASSEQEAELARSRHRTHRRIPAKTFERVSDMTLEEAFAFFGPLDRISGAELLDCAQSSLYRFRTDLKILAKRHPDRVFCEFFRPDDEG